MDSRLVVVTTDPVNAELPLPLQIGTVTPNQLFFMRNRFAIPDLREKSTDIAVTGLVDGPYRISLEELQRLPARTLTVTLECAGNGRSGLEPPAEGEPWSYGAVSTATWTGVPLGTLLEAAGLQDGAGEILAEGVDRGEVRPGEGPVAFARSLPREKALHPDTLVAYAMNGEPLPIDHGYPARLIVPGWYGMASVKWLARLEAIGEPFTGFFQVDRYIMLAGGAVSVPRPLRTMGVRSIFVEPSGGARLSAGRQRLHGLAWSGNGAIDRVEISTNGGRTWTDAALTSPTEPYAWRSWDYGWEATPGQAELRSRATDETGARQPEAGEWNRLGYANNAVQTVMVEVIDERSSGR